MAFADAAAVSAVIALAIGARGRWAFEAAVPMAVLDGHAGWHCLRYSPGWPPQ